MQGCSRKGMNLHCFYSKATHKDHMCRKHIGKTAFMGTLSFIVPLMCMGVRTPHTKVKISGFGGPIGQNNSGQGQN